MATISREMMNQYSTDVASGQIPTDLFMRDVPDFIPVIGRTDTPFTKMMKTGPTWNILKREWGSGDLVPHKTTLETALADAVGTTVDLVNNDYVQQWDLVYFTDNGEIMRVGNVPTTASLTGVTRGFGGTTAAAHSAGVEVIILGPSVPEGADSPSSPHALGTTDFNYPQIFEYTWSATHRGRVTPNYEVKTDRFRAEMKRKMKEAAIDLENTFIYGRRHQGDGSKTNGSATGGIRQFTTQNVTDLNDAALTLKHFLDTMQAIYLKVGQNDMGKTVICSPFMKRVINSFFHQTRRTTATDAKLSIKLDEIETDFGTIKAIAHYNWPVDEVYFLNMDDIKRCAYEGGNWKTGLFSTQGWYDKGFLRGDFGGIYQAPERRGALIDISTNAANYPNLDKIP